MRETLPGENTNFAPESVPTHVPASALVFPKLLHDRNGAPYYQGTQTADGHVIDRKRVPEIKPTAPLDEQELRDAVTANAINKQRQQAETDRYTSGSEKSEPRNGDE